MLNLPLAEIIELNNNKLSGELPLTTAENSLRTLNLEDGFITGGIPLSIQKLRKLQKLFLGMNTLSTVTPVFPDELFSLKNISMIDVTGNQISGEIPRFQRNYLRGEVPRKIANLMVLRALNLSRKHLTRENPTNMQSMVSLVKLDLSYRNLSGSPNLCSQTQRIYSTSSQSDAIQASLQGSSYDIASCRFQTAVVVVNNLYVILHAL
ncbi:hypothetical protein Cgig2_004259 [Carnegiea gigantea]|uniref:Uncharacterized protein n=1 Tax=Carnegiea gigantea TaxID=171969 RepID=A0A9Q1QIH2_9CARY|nr:hypothetical protein Cgig2_004259 [Carnegiea gigantea]